MLDRRHGDDEGLRAAQRLTWISSRGRPRTDQQWATIHGMRFRILGPTQVVLADGREVPVGGPRLRALLALLLLDAGRVVSAERLIDGLYGEHPPRGAANALQSQVSRLRQALPAEHDAVEFHPAGYRLAVDPDDVDAYRFERLAEAGRHALANGDWPRAAAVLREALELWRGPALADAVSAAGAPAQAARLDELRLAAIEDRVEADLALGAHGTLVAELRELVVAHPLRERPRGQLMRALAALGRPAEALAEFEDARHTLAEQLGVDPSAELAATHLAVLRGADRPAAEHGAAEPTHHFVGREEELKRVGELLGERRLVTLTGPGGAGKTRLAIEAAGHVDGEVRFVELAGLADGSDVPQAVLSALGLRDAGLRAPAEPGRLTTDRLVEALAERRLLLVLDNCEHVLVDAARLAARLLSACPALRVLATSREPLGLAGEALCPLSGLSLPPLGASRAGRGRLPGDRSLRPAGRRRGARLHRRRRPTSSWCCGSAAAWTACRWRSSWPPRDCGRCPSPRWPPVSTTGSGCCRRAAGPCRRDTGPSGPWSSGVGICSTTPNGGWPDG